MIALFCFAAGFGAGFFISMHAADAALDSLRQAVEMMKHQGKELDAVAEEVAP
jgi:hypothetical protein